MFVLVILSYPSPPEHTDIIDWLKFTCWTLIDCYKVLLCFWILFWTWVYIYYTRLMLSKRLMTIMPILLIRTGMMFLYLWLAWKCSAPNGSKFLFSQFLFYDLWMFMSSTNFASFHILFYFLNCDLNMGLVILCLMYYLWIADILTRVYFGVDYSVL